MKGVEPVRRVFSSRKMWQSVASMVIAALILAALKAAFHHGTAPIATATPPPSPTVTFSEDSGTIEDPSPTGTPSPTVDPTDIAPPEPTDSVTSTPEPVVQYLADVEPVRHNGPYYTGRYKTNGQWYKHSVELCGGVWADCILIENPPLWADYDVASTYKRLTLTLGLAHDADTDCQQPVQIMAIDARQRTLFDGTLVFGKAYALSYPVNGVLRVRFQTDKAYKGDVCPVVLGDAALQ